jgi:hypothetical protein
MPNHFVGWPSYLLNPETGLLPEQLSAGFGTPG